MNKIRLLGQILLLICTNCGAQLVVNSELKVSHGLAPDKYDYLGDASLCYIISQRSTLEKETRIKLLESSKRSFEKWRLHDAEPQVEILNEYRRKIWLGYLDSFRSDLKKYKNHPYKIDIEKACQDIESVLGKDKVVSKGVIKGSVPVKHK